MGGEVGGLGTVHPHFTLNFFSTWILPLHVVFFPLLFCVESPSVMELWMTGQDPDRLGHRNVGGQKKRFTDHIKSNLKMCNIPFSRLETLASERATWRSTCAFGMSYFDAEYDQAAALRHSRRHHHAAVLRPILVSVHQCPLCGIKCFSRIGLLSHIKTYIQR